MDTLTKNISYIKTNNPTLCDKLSKINTYTKIFDINTNLSGQYNLLIDNKPVHSITNTETEAQEIIENLSNNSNTSIHFIYGIGLGYLVDAFIQNTKGTIIVFEPDLETLHFVLSAVDFSANFETKRLYFVSDKEETDTAMLNLYKYKSKLTLSFLDYHKLYDKENLADFQAFIQRKNEIYAHNYSFQMKNNFVFFQKTLSNLHKKYAYPILTEQKDIFKNVPALIVSAGPSLHKNIETIKKYKDNVLIFCVGTALKTLCQNGIIPDFVHVIERHNTFVHYDVPETKDIRLIAEPFAESSYFNANFKDIIYTSSLETDDARWFLEKAGKPLIPFETKGTVAYHAIYSAYYLGCSPIILIGQDLAYSDGNCYAKGSEFDGLECVFDTTTQKHKIVLNDYEKYKNAYFRAHQDIPEEQKTKIINNRLQELNKNLCTVKGQSGKMLPTDSVYALFIDYIEDFSRRYKKERKLINSSIGGALIKDFDTIPLENAIQEYAKNTLDKEKIIKSIKQSTTNPNTVCANVKSDYQILKNVIKKLQKGVEILEDTNNQDAVVLKKLQILTSAFQEITQQYMQKTRIIKIILFKEFIELDYIAREYNDIESIEIINMYLDAYNNYFRNGLKKSNIVSDILKTTLEAMNN